MRASRVIVAACLAFVCVARAQESSQGVLLDGVAAVVNGRSITVGEVLAEARPALKAAAAMPRGPAAEAAVRTAYSNAVEALIADELVYGVYLREKAAAKFSLPPRAVESRIEDIIRTRFDGDRGALLKALAEERLTYEAWQQRMERQIVIATMINREITRRAQIAPGDALAAYAARTESLAEPEKVHLRRIVISAGTPEARRARAEEARRRVLAGEDFGEVARAVSSRDAEAGGDWGWWALGDLRPELARLAATLSPGAVGGLVDIEGDLYLLKLEARQAARVKPFDEVRESIEGELRRAESDRLFKGWIGQLKRHAYIEVFEQPALYD